MRPGRRLGVDVGRARVGVAVSDPHALLATPLESVPRDLDGGTDLARVLAYAAEYEVVEIVVGLPRTLAGEEGPAAAEARSYARSLAKSTKTPLRLVDERLTTVEAHRGLTAAGRDGRSHRAVVDQQAAVLILQSALDTERSTGQPAGVALHSRKPRSRRGPRGSET